MAAGLHPAAPLGIAWGLPSVAFGALLLLTSNTIAIHLPGVGVPRYEGSRPDGWSGVFRFGGDGLWEVGQIVLFLAISIIVFVGAMRSVTSHVAFESSVNQEVGTVLEQEEYEDPELVAVRTARDGPAPISLSTSQAILTLVNRRVDQVYPQLSQTLARQTVDETDRNIGDVVEFVDRQVYPLE